MWFLKLSWFSCNFFACSTFGPVLLLFGVFSFGTFSFFSCLLSLVMVCNSFLVVCNHFSTRSTRIGAGRIGGSGIGVGKYWDTVGRSGD